MRKKLFRGRIRLLLLVIIVTISSALATLSYFHKDNVSFEQLHETVKEDDVEQIIIGYFLEDELFTEVTFEKGDAFLSHILYEFNALEIDKEFSLDEASEVPKINGILIKLTDGEEIEAYVLENGKTLVIRADNDEENTYYQGENKLLGDIVN